MLITNQCHRRIEAMMNSHRMNKAIRIMDKAQREVLKLMKTGLRMRMMMGQKMFQKLNNWRLKSRKFNKKKKVGRKSRSSRTSKHWTYKAKILSRMNLKLSLKLLYSISIHLLNYSNLQLFNLNPKTFPSRLNNKQTDHYWALRVRHSV